MGNGFIERKGIEKALLESEERYRAFFKTSRDCVFITSVDGRWVDLNDAAVQFFGYGSKEDLLKVEIKELYANPDERTRHLQVIKEKGYTKEYPVTLRKKDGTVIYTLITSVTRKDGTGRIIGYQGTIRDITERKRADFIRERSLARQEQLNLLQQTLLSPGKLELKLKKITDSIVEIFGADFCRIWITSPGDLCEVGCVHATVTEGPHVCRYRDRCLRLIASSGRYTHTDGEVHRRVPFGCYKIGRVASGEEHKFLTNDVQNEPRIHNREWAKEIGLISFAGYQLRPPGENTLGVLALFSKQNITVDEDAQLDSLSNTITRVIQSARVDEELRQYRDLLEDRVRERTAEMERFIYTVSHDLRSPLVTLSGFVGLLKDDMEMGDSQRAFSDLLTMNEAITKMDRLLMDTLELSRIGRVINPIENASFDHIVREALEQTAERIRFRNVAVSVAQDLPDVRVDMPRIVEVLVNLIENSIKYMGDQEGPTIEIGSRKDSEETVFFVRDNGIGIDPKEHDKVFGLFYKVDSKSEGTGAGLSIVKRIIEVHGGRIWIESELGKGCTVCFTLPLADYQ